ncbi:DUF924 family protein [Inmirania thermothiophila]|uniref:Uncharacterized protein (DUF924 family) n=1 Tax=Inmirania thermothiophila TaxID=1750597 RepID=A0A3N1Y7F2_9GAMM|nr:DUF924 family protein [Inmirania thermothiophila]ROR34441.1 uncharacterized protein (DUF924 family) [Inmirania thermothiophila]
MDARDPDPREVLDFWFDARVRGQWFRATPALDAEIRDRFEGLWRRAAGGGLAAWEATAEGALALVIVLDQFPLNMFRGRPEAFSTEALAREVAARAIARGLDAALDDAGRAFLYLPFMHSEDLRDQDRAVALFAAAGLEDNLRWARHHREIVRRFGRFPHRNAVLGRPSTPEEEAWLASPEAFRG